MTKMSGKCVLDTNIVIGIFAADNKILKKLKSDSQIFIPGIVLGELFYGAMLSTQVKENVKRIEELAQSCPVLNCDGQTSFIYGKIKSGLKLKGKPIPENDIWIAALSIQHKIKLISRDSHFSFIDGLEIEEW